MIAWFRVVLACAVALASCSNDADVQSPPPNPFVGEWTCRQNESLTFPDSTVTGLPQTVRFTIASPAQGLIVVVSDNPGSCPLKFSTLDGFTTFVLESGQSCETTAGTTYTYGNGTATVTNRALAVDVNFGVTQAADGSAGRTGTGAMTDRCTPLGQDAGAL
jgi:hypothetical protein